MTFSQAEVEAGEDTWGHHSQHRVNAFQMPVISNHTGKEKPVISLQGTKLSVR